MFPKAVKLFDVGGFEIRADPSWLVIAALVVWSLASGYFPETVPGLHRGDYIALALAAAAGLFGGLVLHELAHAVVARREGLAVGGITLFLFGGVAELGGEPRSPASEVRIALAGPAMSVTIAAAAGAAMTLVNRAGSSPALVGLLGYVAGINLILGLFNLLPAFPLDGGRVLRAVLWRVRGDMLSATRTASRVGAAFGYALVALGLAALLAGQPAAGGVWPILVGLFLAAAAQATYRQALADRALHGHRVGDLMTRAVVTSAPDRTLTSLVDDVMLAHGVGFVPVLQDRTPLGYIDTATLRGIDRENWDTLRVEDVFVPLAPGAASTPAEPLDRLMRRMAETGRRKFLVVDGDRFAGVITLSDLVAHIDVLRDLAEAGRTRAAARAI